MRTSFKLLPFIAMLGLSPLMHAADVDFNGRWDIMLWGDNPDKAWWMEVSGAGTPAIKGKFIGFPGGDLNDIKDIRIEEHQLLFSFENKAGKRQYAVSYF